MNTLVYNSFNIYIMSINKQTKLNLLLSSYPVGVVLQTSWLEKEGYSYALQQSYRKNGWLKLLGRGAMIRPSDKVVSYTGGIYALQVQSGLMIHPGAKTALNLLGKAHYLEMSVRRVSLFGGEKERLPTWLRNYDWGQKIAYYPTSFLPADLGLVQIDLGNFSIQISSGARAILECLYLAPGKMELQECYELIEGLNDLNPCKVQQLLEVCTSIKVKRLFLYLSERTGHAWFKNLDLEKIDLGKGKRSIVKNGAYIEKYQITVPRALAQNEPEI